MTRTLPHHTSYDDRALALARRLGIDVPEAPADMMAVWIRIGKALLRTDEPRPATLNQLWADVGMFLAETNEPEFSWGKGRRPGSENKKLMQTKDPRVLYKRAYRRKRQGQK